jgi:hypothetical protein
MTLWSVADALIDVPFVARPSSQGSRSHKDLYCDMAMLAQVPRQPDRGCRAVTQFPNDLVAGSKNLADADGIEAFREVVLERLLFNLLAFWEPLISRVGKHSGGQRGAAHST